MTVEVYLLTFYLMYTSIGVKSEVNHIPLPFQMQCGPNEYFDFAG